MGRNGARPRGETSPHKAAGAACRVVMAGVMIPVEGDAGLSLFFRGNAPRQVIRVFGRFLGRALCRGSITQRDGFARLKRTKRVAASIVPAAVFMERRVTSSEAVRERKPPDNAAAQKVTVTFSAPDTPANWFLRTGLWLSVKNKILSLLRYGECGRLGRVELY